MEGYRVKHNLSYQQFPDIINKLPFHNLSFGKNLVKYCRKNYFCENYTHLLKIENRAEKKLSVTFWNQFLIHLIQRKYLLNDCKTYHLSPLSTKPKSLFQNLTIRQ